MRGPVGGDQCVLDGVSGLLAVAQGPQGDRPEPVAVTPHEFAEGLVVARDVTGEEVLIACVAVSGVYRPSDPLPCVARVQPVNVTSVMACL